jgi:hypothetical protein
MKTVQSKRLGRWETGPPGAWRGELADPSDASGQFPHVEILADIQREWDLAEEGIKRCEQVSRGAIIPAIKELRYAGRRIVDALNKAHKGGTEQEVRALLEDARFNCHRARHDAMDAALDIMALDFDNLTKRLGYDAVIQAYPEFQSLYRDFANARKQIAISRGDRENRNVIYETISNIDFPDIADRYADLVTCKPIALAASAKARRQRISWWFMLCLTLISLAVAASSYVNGKRMLDIAVQRQLAAPKR